MRREDGGYKPGCDQQEKQGALASDAYITWMSPGPGTSPAGNWKPFHIGTVTGTNQLR
jgi:hypothetical protein